MAAVATAVQNADAAIIFSDTFSGTGNLNGTVPDDRPGTETWTSGTTEPIPTVGSGTANVAFTGSSYLAWTPSSGAIYSLSVDMKSSGTTTATSTFAGFGFFNSGASTTTYAGSSSTTPWAFIRTGNISAGSIGDVVVRPLGSSGNDINTNYTVTNTIKLELILNTTDTDVVTNGDQWSLMFLVNGVQIGTTTTYNEADSTALLNGIKRIGLTNATDSNAVTYDNFVLQTIPEPSTAAVLSGGLGLLALRRRK